MVITLNEIIRNLNYFLDMLGEWMRGWINYLDDMNMGLNIAVRVIMIVLSIMVISFLFKRMLKSQIKESAFLMWTLPAALLFIYGVWPELTYYIADLTHMAYGYALVVTVPFIALLYFIAFKYMCQIAALTSKVVELGSVVSLQKHEIDDLKKQISSMKQPQHSQDVSANVDVENITENSSLPAESNPEQIAAEDVEVIVH